MKNNLPNGWFILNSGRTRRFENIFKGFEPFKWWNLKVNGCYGIDSKGKAFFETNDQLAIIRHEDPERITLNEFTELSKPIEPSIEDEKGFVDLEGNKVDNFKYVSVDFNDHAIDAFLYSIGPMVDKIQKSLVGHPNEALKLSKGFQEMSIKIRQSKEELKRHFTAEDYALHSNEQVCDMLDEHHDYVLKNMRNDPCYDGSQLTNTFKIDNGLLKQEDSNTAAIDDNYKPEPYTLKDNGPFDLIVSNDDIKSLLLDYEEWKGSVDERYVNNFIVQKQPHLSYVPDGFRRPTKDEIEGIAKPEPTLEDKVDEMYKYFKTIKK